MKRIVLLLVVAFMVSSFGQNTKYGEGAGKHFTTGYDNTLYGVNAGYWLSTGYKNILFGFKAGSNLTTGYNNIIIGNNINATGAATANYLNIGNAITGNLSTGVVTIPLLANTTSTFDSIKTRALTLGTTAITSTGTQINYLSSAAGTTGSTSTSLVFSTSPSLTTPTLSSVTPTSNYSGDVGTKGLRYDSTFSRYFVGDKQVLIRDDNATVFNWGGKPSYPVERTDTMYAYGGMYGNPEYWSHGIGSSYSRFIIGTASVGMDFQIQSAGYLLLTGVGETDTGKVVVMSNLGTKFYPHSDGDNASSYLEIDKVDTLRISKGTANTSNITLKTSSGALEINGVSVLDSTLEAYSYNFEADTSTADDYEVVMSGLKTYKTGMEVTIKVATANTDGATLEINALGAKAITKASAGVVTTALATGDVLAAQIIKVVYDGTQFQIISRLAQ